jgi:hypothetical protein
MPKNPQCKKSAKLENFLKIRFFYPLVPPWGKKIEFSKSFPIWLIFCTGGFFGMGNSNPKEFFDFDDGKVPYKGLKPKNGVLPCMGYLFINHFLTITPMSRTKNNGGFVFSA